jgi:hypothetical protein
VWRVRKEREGDGGACHTHDVIDVARATDESVRIARAYSSLACAVRKHVSKAAQHTTRHTRHTQHTHDTQDTHNT